MDILILYLTIGSFQALPDRNSGYPIQSGWVMFVKAYPCD